MGCWVSCVSKLMATTYPKHTNTLTRGIQTESFPLCLVSLKWLRNLTPLTTSCSSADWSHIWTLIPLRTHKTLCKARDTRQMLSNFITRHYSTHSHRWKWENALHCNNRVMNTKFRTELPVNPGARAKSRYVIHETIKRMRKIYFRGQIYSEMTNIDSPSCTTFFLPCKTKWFVLSISKKLYKSSSYDSCTISPSHMIDLCGKQTEIEVVVQWNLAALKFHLCLCLLKLGIICQGWHLAETLCESHEGLEWHECEYMMTEY